MPAANVIQLRQLLSEKFPGLRTRLNDRMAFKRSWPTGLPGIDEPLHGGLPKGALSEFIAAGKSSGSASLLRALLERAARENQIVTLVDGTDSLDAAAMDENVLARLLWVRCNSADTALKAADLILRDSNLSLALLDLAANPPAQLRRIPATTWYRLQRLVEGTSAVCAIFTPFAMVAPAQARIMLNNRFSIDALDAGAEALARGLKLEAADARQLRQAAARRDSA